MFATLPDISHWNPMGVLQTKVCKTRSQSPVKLGKSNFDILQGTSLNVFCLIYNVICVNLTVVRLKIQIIYNIIATFCSDWVQTMKEIDVNLQVLTTWSHRRTYKIHSAKILTILSIYLKFGLNFVIFILNNFFPVNCESFRYFSYITM